MPHHAGPPEPHTGHRTHDFARQHMCIPLRPEHLSNWRACCSFSAACCGMGKDTCCMQPRLKDATVFGASNWWWGWLLIWATVACQATGHWCKASMHIVVTRAAWAAGSQGARPASVQAAAACQSALQVCQDVAHESRHLRLPTSNNENADCQTSRCWRHNSAQSYCSCSLSSCCCCCCCCRVQVHQPRMCWVDRPLAQAVEAGLLAAGAAHCACCQRHAAAVDWHVLEGVVADGFLASANVTSDLLVAMADTTRYRCLLL
ncbi:hypothetical protein COO60DRAFT_1546006 [Scenedesmus sp. NREL 46B-D3]|nr:hypothetical protein COO60DRAFT_1546006 [Scenedesmus sp. NREL 46B-D3]